MALKDLLHMRTAIIATWAIALLAAVLLIGPDRMIHVYSTIRPVEIRRIVLSFGALSPAAFIFINMIRPFTFLPVTPFTVAGGYIFGHFYGLILSIIGTMLSAVLTFSMSRYLFKDQIKRWLKGRYGGVDKRFESSGILMIAAARVIPVIPFDAVSYVAGISDIAFTDYLIGSLIGELPGAFVLTMLGSNLGQIGTPVFYLSLALFILLMAIPEIFKRIVRYRDSRYKK
ncbi:MAG TPA: TVP38/TMEM64 family protein [Methanocellaceae archaeon]|jgi:uncharacterized membrane protein YdjX (TVP38/TMEM64 family)